MVVYSAICIARIWSVIPNFMAKKLKELNNKQLNNQRKWQ